VIDDKSNKVTYPNKEPGKKVSEMPSYQETDMIWRLVIMKLTYPLRLRKEIQKGKLGPR
jgi:hypothetical protein